MPKKPLALSPVSAPGAFRLKIERARCHLGIDEIVAMAMESGSLSEWTNSCNFWLLLVRSFSFSSWSSSSKYFLVLL